ncbi:hypothetical protein PATA110616_21275 [Paenibacillus tarimensis]
MLGPIFEMVIITGLYVIIDLPVLRKGTRRSRYWYAAMLGAAGVGWVIIRINHKLPHIGNWLEKLTI